MKNSLLYLATLALLTGANAALADDIQLGVPAYGGSGCPAGSASATLSPDQKALSILFDSFSVEAGATAGTAMGRKSCNLAIPVHVPHGFSISIFQVDYRGYTFVPAGGRALLSAEYFFAGARGPVLTRNFVGPRDDNYLFTNNLAATALVWSPCGVDVNLRVNASMLAQTNQNWEQVLATVDSADITSGLVYHIEWRSCN